MTIFLKRIVLVFLFGLSVGLSLNNNSNSEFNSNENSIILVNSLRGGGNDSNQKPAFMKTPPGQRYSAEQSTNSQDRSEMPPRFGYKTSLSDGKKLPDNPGVVVRITNIMRMSSLGKMFKKTLKCGLNIRNTVKINLKKINNVI